ncbi:hypothetical protein [Streptomyces sp. NPDC046909]|uniref:hypothetical protein n=1 Tax=Streptomyces sp. NPDC046909 TaxID=3155617 RepID=UPI0033E63F8B
MDEQHRYHLTLTVGGKPARHGWWGSEKVARAKFTLWVSECTGRAGSHVTLVDEVTGETLDTWPVAS